MVEALKPEKLAVPLKFENVAPESITVVLPVVLPLLILIVGLNTTGAPA